MSTKEERGGRGLPEVKEEQKVTNNQLDYSGNPSPFAFEPFAPFNPAASLKPD